MAAAPQASGMPVRDRLEYLTAGLGSNRTARLLGVAPSTVSRWRSGQDRISLAAQARVIDLDYLLTRLLRVLPADAAEVWLESFNDHLRAVPLHVLERRGALAVLPAVEAEEQEAYA